MEANQQIGYTFRLPKTLKDALRDDAEKHSRSINQHVVDILTGYMSGELIPAEKLLTDPSVRRLLRAAMELRDEKPKAKRR